MKKVFSILFLASLFLAGCNGNRNKMRETIAALEEASKGAPGDITFRPLLQQYNAYLKEYGSDQEWCPIYLYRGSQIYFRAGNYGQCLNLLGKIFSDYPKSDIQPNALALAGMIYDEYLEKPEEAKEAFKKLEEQYGETKVAQSAVSFYKKPAQDKLLARIAEMQPKFNASLTTPNPDRIIGGLLLGHLLQFVQRYPDDGHTPEYLFRAGQASVALGDSQRGVQLFEEMASKFPDSEFAPRALITAAFETESKLNDLPKAKTLYEAFIQKYPKHNLVNDAKTSLKNLGKSPDEIVEGFIKKN